jgi:beta-glucanase (GH16 family)
MDGNGNLVIQARLESNGKWTSGRMKSQGLAEFTYGRIEARMRLPNNCAWNGAQCTGLQGIWPAFWMMGSNGVGWPGNGELDIMENIGKQPATVHSTLHGTGYSAGYGKPYRSADGLPFGNAFHVYGMIWSPLEVRFYVDDPNNVFADFTADMIRGQKGANSSQGRWEFWGHPFYLLFNLAVGGMWPGDPDDTTASPQNLIIDWVRVYQWAQPAAPVLLTAQPVPGNQVQLAWKASASTASNLTYTVFRSTQRGAAHALANLVASQISVTAFTDVPPQPGVTYYYVVTASSPDAPESAVSNELSVTTPAGGSAGH